MATIDTIAGVLESNLDIDPATVTPEATFESLGIDWTWSSSSATWRRPARSTSASPRDLSPWATWSLTSTRCKRPSRFSRTGAPQPSGCGAFLLPSSLRLCRKRPHVGSCRSAGGNVSEPRSIRAVALHFYGNRFRSAFPVMAASRFISSRSVGEGSCRCMRLTVMSV